MGLDQPPLALPGAAHLVLSDAVSYLDKEESFFDAMLHGWRNQQLSRQLARATIAGRLALIRRFKDFTNDYPWQWTPEDLETFCAHLAGDCAKSTMRGYQGELRLFMEFLTDPRYDWSARCAQTFGTVPRQICHEWNTLEHLSEFEGKPTRRPLTFDEVEQLFDYLDSRVKAIRGLGRKGALAAYRDATLFKTYYAYGLRRNEGRQLDLSDFHHNPSARQWGRFGSVHVRFGKAVRGGPPRRRLVWTLPEFDWIIDVLREYIEYVRPRYNPGKLTALWLTERGTIVSNEYITARFEELRRGAGLPDDLELHCLRHSYGTHLAEFGYDPEFRREQMGHTYLSTTGIYTHVSRDYKQFVLETALRRLYAPRPTRLGSGS